MADIRKAVTLDLDIVDRLLTTTRSVRKRLDFSRPVELSIIEACIDIAMQAPTGSNAQGWYFMVITDAEKRRKIGDLYRQSWRSYLQEVRNIPATPDASDPRAQRAGRVFDSAMYLARHMHEAPVLIIPCIQGRVQNPAPVAQASLYGSILPATWSLMLALRARGIGSSWTTLHLAYEQEAAQILEIPDQITQVALLPVAYYTGADFRPAKRIPASERTYVDTWGHRLG